MPGLLTRLLTTASARATGVVMLGQTGANPGPLVPREKLQDVSKHINDGVQHDVPWELLLAGLGATLIAITVISIRRWWLARQQDPSPLVLYSAIARRAGLSWSDRFVLWRIARAGELPTPIALLLARGTLRHYSRSFARRLTPHAADRLRKRVERIESVLFQ